MTGSTWASLFTWYNLPFTLLLFACGVLAILQMIGLGGGDDSETGAEVDHDLDLDHGVDVDHDVDLDHSADLDHDLDHDVDHDLDHGDVGEPGVLTVLAFIGLGKAPLFVVLLIFFGAVGVIGWALNALITGVLGDYPGLAFAGVLPASIIGGGLISSRVARFIGRALPPISTTATRAQALVGRRGTVISPFVDEKYGMVRLRDAGGTLISVFAVQPSGEPIKRGCDVVLVAYDPAKKLYTVAPV